LSNFSADLSVFYLFKILNWIYFKHFCSFACI